MASRPRSKRYAGNLQRLWWRFLGMCLNLYIPQSKPGILRGRLLIIHTAVPGQEKAVRVESEHLNELEIDDETSA
jgi:hypothetical protein